MIEVKLLIRQIRSLGSQSKAYGEHAPHLFNHKAFIHALLIALWNTIGVGKPEVAFKAPTCLTGGSNFSSTPQGGYYKIKKKVMLIMKSAFGGHIIPGPMIFLPFSYGNLKNRDQRNIKPSHLLYSAPKVLMP